MSIRSTVALALVCAISVSSAAETATAPQPSAKADAMAASFEKAAALGPQHRQLAQLVGDWTVKQFIWSGAQSAPKIDEGHATFAMVIGGRHLRQELQITTSAKPFEGLGYIGYDNLSGEYYSSWMDVNFTGVIIARGNYDKQSNTYTFIGSMADPANGGKETRLREVMRVVTPTHFTYEYYEAHEGKETLAVKLEYTRL